MAAQAAPMAGNAGGSSAAVGPVAAGHAARLVAETQSVEAVKREANKAINREGLGPKSSKDKSLALDDTRVEETQTPYASDASPKQITRKSGNLDLTV